MAAAASPAGAASITARPLSTACGGRSEAPRPRAARSRRRDPLDVGASGLEHRHRRRRRRRAGSPRPARRWPRRSGARGAARRCRRRCGAWRSVVARDRLPADRRQLRPGRGAHAEARAAGPTMSPRTAPASTEASCSGSPTRIRRASGRTASTSRAISDSDTIDVSSTTTTSWGSRLSRSWRNRVRLPGLNPSSRCSVVPAERGEAGPHRSSTAMRGRLGVHGLLEPGRRLAGRRGQGDERRRAGRGRLLVEQGQDPGHRGRLAGARAAGDHRDPAQHGGGGGQALEVGAVDRRRTAAPGPPPAGRRRRRRPGAAAAREQVGGHLALVGPVPVEVEGRPVEAQGPVVAHQRALATAASTHSRVGPGQRRRRRPAVDVGAGRAAMVARSTQTWPSRGARAAKAAPSRTASSVVPLRPGQPQGDVDVGGGEDAGRVERGSEPGGAERQPGVEGVGPASASVTARPRVEEVAQRLDQRRRRPPGPDAAGLAVDAGGSAALMPRTNR